MIPDQMSAGACIQSQKKGEKENKLIEKTQITQFKGEVRTLSVRTPPTCC